MSFALSQRLTGNRSIRQALPWAGMGLCLAVLVSHVAYDWLGRGRSQGAPAKSGSAPATKPGGEPSGSAPRRSTTITLKDPKFKAAQFKVEPARLDRLATGVSVVGVIQVNSDRQVEVRPRAAGNVREVHALLGQKVKRGDPLVTLDSREIGTARLDLRARQRELSTARFEGDWKSEIAANVALLIPELRKGIIQHRSGVADDEDHIATPAREPGKPASVAFKKATDTGVIAKQFADKQLGAYRGTLLQAYADFDIAIHEEQKTASLRIQKIVGEHPALVAHYTREGIQAKLEAAVEQVHFDSAQEKRLADQKVRLAEGAVVDAAQRLRILGVSEDIQYLLDHAGEANALAREEDVTFYQIVAPFDGTIIKKGAFAVPSQRADLNDVLFSLADLRSVWVTANVSESDIAKMPKIKDGAFRLSATAYPNREFSARLLSVGALVDPQTRTVPLLAQTDNPDDVFKLGMFVRILLDGSVGEPVLTVPVSAVVEIETEKYVFVPAGKGPDNRTFTLRPIEAGNQSGDRLVVKAGLNQADEVVSSGAFLLKSELILQNQTDEE
ncbi:MAG: efflux RND transporter periplasmic adaptor subunit [Isosphaerales bacterium]